MSWRYEFKNGDIDPQFLYAHIIDRTEEETECHSHDFIELVIIMKGRGRLIIDGKALEAEEGNVLVINPQMSHRSMPDGTMRECYLAFSNVEYEGCVKNCLPLFGGYHLMVRLPEKLKKQIFQICDCIKKESIEPHCGQYPMMKAYLIQLLCLLARNEETVKEIGKRYVFRAPGKEYVVGQIQKYFAEHYREKISLSQIAENMYLSPVYISKIFKSETGDTPINYLIGLRMEKAREILEKTPFISIQKVAEEVGYDDAYHFSKLFKKYYGISPIYFKARKNIE